MSNKTEKERATKKVKNIFTGGRGSIISNEEMLNLFNQIVSHNLSKVGSYPETLYKVGETHKPLNLNIRVYGDSRGRGSISTVQLGDFAQKALNEIENYRLIHCAGWDGIYKIIEKLSNQARTYVLTYENEPRFRMQVSPTEHWIAGPMTFEEYQGISTFTHSFDFEGTKRAIIETSVAKKARNNMEGLAKKIFLSFHEQLVGKYLKLGMTSVEE